MRSKFILVLAMVIHAGIVGAAEQEMVLQPDQIISNLEKTDPKAKTKNEPFWGSNAINTETADDKKQIKEKPGQKAKTGPEIYKEIDLPATTPDDATGGQVAIPIITQKAVMSRSGENWIMCEEPIKQVLHGDDAHIDVKYYGTSAFVKFQYLTDGEKIVYPAPKATPMYIPCAGAIYSLVAVPMDVTPKSIRLGSGHIAKIRDNATIFKEQDTRKKVQELVRRAYNDDLPESFDVKLIDKPLNLYRDVSVMFHRTISIAGEGMVLKEYFLTPTVDGVEFTEKQFIRKEITPIPTPISVIPLRPAKGERSRLFVVEFPALTDGKGSIDVQ